MIGEIISTNKCQPCGSGATWGPSDCSSVFSNEWSYIGENPCNYDCKVGGIFPGTSARCQKTSYGGSKKDCCLTNKSPSGSCNPTHIISNPNCDSTFSDHCSIASNIVSDEKCNRWRSIRPAPAFLVMKNFCEKNPSHPECIRWCKANLGVCDKTYIDWCKNRQDPICACINSPLTKLGVNPKCNDRTCIVGGFLTKNMIDTACPNIVDCSIQVPMQNSGAQLVNLNIDQQCKSDTKPSPPPLSSPPPSSDNQFVFLLIFVVFMLVVVFCGYLVRHFWKVN